MSSEYIVRSRLKELQVMTEDMNHIKTEGRLFDSHLYLIQLKLNNLMQAYDAWYKKNIYNNKLWC